MGWLERVFRVRTLCVGLLWVVAGCSGPTCESACVKAFETCGLTSLDPAGSIDNQIAGCTRACSEDMAYTSEERAVGWVGCVEEFQCDPADEGIDLCLTCQAGYYLGRTSPNACSYSEETARTSFR